MAKIVKQGVCTYKWQGSEKDAQTYTLTDDGTLTISGEGGLYGGEIDEEHSVLEADGLDCFIVYFSQFKDMAVERVVIEEGVTTLQEYCLRKLPMTEVVLPSTVTYIGHAAFGGCERLATVVLPSTMERIEEDAFGGCTSLSTETVALIDKYIDTPATIDGLTFMLRPRLGEAVLMRRTYPRFHSRGDYPDDETYYRETCYTGDLVVPATVIHGDREYKVTGIGKINKHELKSITLPATLSFIDDEWISHSFSIDPPVVRIADVAAWCGVILFQAEMHYNAVSAFKKERRLYLGDSPEPVTELVIPEGVTEIADAVFNSCTSLRKLVLPQGLKRIGHWAFDGCSSLESIDIPEGVSEIGRGAFRGCKNLKHIGLPASLVSLGHSAFWECELLKEIELHEGIDFDLNCNSLFKGCSSLKRVELPEGVERIYDHAFEGCTSLEHIVLPSTLTYMSKRIFDDCTCLKSIESRSPYFTMQNSCLCTDEGQVVLGINQPHVIIPDGITEICDDAFNGCNQVVEVTLPASVTVIGNRAFAGCTLLTEVVIADGVKTLPSRCFMNCTALEKIYVPDSVQKIECKAFEGCSSLREVRLPQGICVEAGSFHGCPCEADFHIDIASGDLPF